MASPLCMPLEVVRQPGTTRVDYFVLAPDGTYSHVPHWSGPGSGPPPDDWFSLGGDGSSLRAYGWTPDNSELVLHLVGDDGVIYTNTLTAATSTWSGWQRPNPDGSLAYIHVATS